MIFYLGFGYNQGIKLVFFLNSGPISFKSNTFNLQILNQKYRTSQKQYHIIIDGLITILKYYSYCSTHYNIICFHKQIY